MTARRRPIDRPFVDTNILVYAVAANDPRAATAERLLEQRPLISVQVLSEFVSVASGQLRMPWSDVLEALASFRVLCPSPVAITPATHDRAVDLAGRHRLDIYDALIVSAALDARCTTLYSEDLHDGQVVEGMTIRNPFGRAR